jgi:hypothetical protein
VSWVNKGIVVVSSYVKPNGQGGEAAMLKGEWYLCTFHVFK